MDKKSRKLDYKSTSTKKAGKTVVYTSSEEGLRESERERVYNETTHDYGNFLKFGKNG